MTSIYRTILKIAWQVVWQAKFLWFFGLFVALLGNGGELNIFFNNFNFVKNESWALGTLDSWHEAGGRLGFYFKELFTNLNVTLSIVLVLSVLVILFLIWLVMVCQAGLINGVFKFHKKRPTDFYDSLTIGKEKFWPVLLLNIINKVFVYIVLLAIGLPLVISYLKNVSYLSQALLIVLSFIILVPLAIIISLVMRYAIIFSITKGYSVGESVKRGWGLFKKNWIVSIEMTVVLFVLNLIMWIIVFASFAILVIPYLLLGYGFFAFGLEIGVSILYIIAIVFVVATVIFIADLFSVFQTSAWTLLYIRMSEGIVYPKIARVIAWLAVKIKK